MTHLGEQWPAAAGYLDTPAYGLPAHATVSAMQNWLEQWTSGRTRFSTWLDATEQARAAFAGIVGVPVGAVATGTGASQLVGLIAASLPDYGRVLVAEDEFASLLYPLLVQERRGVSVTECPLEQLAETIGPRFDLVAFSLVSSATGKIAPHGDICLAARAARVAVLADAAQACGWLQADWGRFDYVVCPAFKWLSCPRGVAFLVVAPEWLEQLAPHGAGWFASDGGSHFFGGPLRLASDARRLDVSPIWPSWAGAQPALELIHELGVDAMGVRAIELANRFRAHLDLPDGDTPIVVLDDPRVAARLEAAGLTVSPRARGARLGFHHYNTNADADRAADALDGVIGSLR
jgi:selenocysteine lyase/cysteine desulfurase